MKTKLSVLAIAVLATFSSATYAESFALSSGSHESDDDVTYESSTYATSITGNATATFNGNFSATSMSSALDSWNAAVLVNGGDSRTVPVLNLGSISTQNINLKSQGAYTIGLWAWKSGKITVTGENLVVDVTADATLASDAAAYGIIAQNNSVPSDNRENKATIVIDAENTYVNANYIGAIEDENAVSALLAMSEGILKVNGNLFAKAPSVITARGNSIVAINEKNQEKIIQLDGDINFDYDQKSSGTKVDSTVIVNLNGSSSYWNGSATASYGSGSTTDENMEVNGLKLGLSNGAQWTPTLTEKYGDGTKGSEGIAINNLTFDDGVINVLHGSTQVVEIEYLDGNGGTVNVKATTEDGKSIDSGSIKVSETAEGVSLTVNATGINADDITDPEAAMESLSDKIEVTTGQLTKIQNFSEGDIKGAITQTIAADGTKSAVKTSENTKLASFRGLNATALVAWRDEVAYTNQRMEFLRDNSHAYGAWAQVYGGESKYEDKAELTTTTVQVGADMAVGDWVAGAAFSYMTGEADMLRGDADTDAYTLSLYAERNFDSGLFVNGLARYGRLSTDATAGNMDASYDNNAFSLGGNVGYRFTFAEQAFVEPNFGLQYAYVMGDDYKASNGVKVEQDDFDALIASLGARVGFNFPNDAGKVFARASVNHDFLGEIDGTASKADLAESMYVDLGGTWVTYGVGTQFNITDNLSVWGNVDRTTGGEVSTNYMMNAGLRYVF